MASITDIERLNYYEGEFLGALDFQTEQEYHRDMRRRHNVGQHTWGIVSGLDLVQIPNGLTAPDGTPAVDVYIQPGMAIDGFGREIVVLNKTQLTPDLFAAYTDLVGIHTMSIWISYGQVMLQPPTDTCAQINQPNAFGRVQEAFALTVTQKGNPPSSDLIVVDGKSLPAPTPPGSPPPPPPQPGDIAVPNDDSIPYQEFSTDDSTVNWYITLGQVSWDPRTGLFGTHPALAVVDRQYVGSVASTVYAPAGALTLKDRFTTSPLPAGSNGVSVEVEGSLTVDRLLNAEQNILVGSVFDPTNPLTKALTISPVTISASSTDQSFIQFRDSSGPALFSIWETPAQTGPPIPAGLNFGEADASSGKPGTSDLFIQKGGNVGIGTQAPAVSLDVRGQASFQGVGIGTQTPAAGLSLDVRGQASFQGALSINHASVTGVGSPNDVRAAITFGATDTPSAFYFGTYDGNTARATTILGLWSYQLNSWIQYWTPNGNVGIGTVAPNARLEVQQTGTNDGIRVSGGINPLMAATDGTIRAKLQVLTVGGEGLVGTETNHNFGIYTNNQERVTITNGGNVGIGTTAPTAQLEVTGAVTFQGKSLVQIYRLYNSGTGDHFYTPSAAERITAIAGGYVDETGFAPNFFAFA